ncbi:uncharacterized protein N7529_005284 [Penicillium soppii]|uniref:uncharacterized protein n=1 Tax=Penicillium soppii TaxID=69789 RepID=UPI0025496C7E|nr:uncharacterized protein N7529_005284 [Penicillium soppii]KAJ5872931.1 hypothetical protein N7529_005284 [Penicillium soppii]
MSFGNAWSTKLVNFSPLSGMPSLQINKAIASLQQNMSDDSMGRLRVETALVACVVLISTLLFQENATLAGRHLFSGYRLLEHYLISHGSNSLFAATITRAFGVIHLTWTLFTSAEPPDKDARLPLLVPETIIRGGDDIQTANDLVVTLIRIGCSQNWAQGFNIGPASPDLDIDQMAIVRQIQRIPSQIQAYRVLHAHQSTQRDLSAFLILQLWAEVISITATVETGPEPQEMIFDRYIVRFKEALEISKELLVRISSTPSFSVNLGVIPPLFVLAMKCRDWEIRRQIVDLLRVFRRQEGIWSTDLAALITERVIDIESAGFGPGDLIPESSRIKSLLVDAMTTKSQVRLRYHFVRDCPGFCCNHAEPYEEEISSYASGRFEILECSRRP